MCSSYVHSVMVRDQLVLGFARRRRRATRRCGERGAWVGHLFELFDDISPGYRRMERTERNIAHRTVCEHGDLVRLWAKLIDTCANGLCGVHAVKDQNEDKRFARIVHIQFFALGISYSKSALDAVLIGNYHHTFFSTRYLAELLIQAMYARIRSDEARRWYKQHPKPPTADFEPTFGQAFKCVKKAATDKRAVQQVYAIAKEMDRHGAHPSQEVLLQTLS